jgi:AraC family transcriptional regulator
MADDLIPRSGARHRPEPVAVTPRIFARYEDRQELYLADEPLVAGGARDSYVFERHSVAPGALHAHVFDHHMFLLPFGTAPVPFYSRLNGRRITGAFVPGHFRFLAAGDSLSTSWNETVDCILMAIHPGLIQRALGEDRCDAPPELISNILPHRDPILEHLVATMERHLTSSRPAGKLFEQSLLTTIAAHLFHAHGNGCRGRNRNAPLTHWMRARIENHVRENLGRPIGLNEIAQTVNLSPYHLSRSFRATTGQGLWQFVLECRVQEAMRMIRAANMAPLSQIARACGFETYSQFIAAFRKFLGQLPSEYRAAHRRKFFSP